MSHINYCEICGLPLKDHEILCVKPQPKLDVIHLSQDDLNEISSDIKDGHQAGFVERADKEICWQINFWEQPKNFGNRRINETKKS